MTGFLFVLLVPQFMRAEWSSRTVYAQCSCHPGSILIISSFLTQALQYRSGNEREGLVFHVVAKVGLAIIVTNCCVKIEAGSEI